MAGERPLGVTILAVLALLAGLFAILGGLITLAMGGIAGNMLGNEYSALVVGYTAGSGIIAIIVGLIELAIGWGLWNGKNWAWWLSVIFSALGVLGGLAGLVGAMALGGAAILAALVNLIIAAVVLWYLFKPHVKEFFGITVEFST